jgi:superfamily II DNA or RNA helicase
MRRKVHTVPLIIDTHLKINQEKIPEMLAEELRKKFTYPNPEFYKKLRLGFWVGSTPKLVEAYQENYPFLFFPRGCLDEIKRIMLQYNYVPNPIVDKTLRLEKTDIKLKLELRDYQIRAIDALIRTGNGVIRGPAGSGKTILLLGAIARLAQPTLIIVHSGALFEQWVRNINDTFGFMPGIIRANKCTIKQITVGMQQSVWRKENPEWAKSFGCICGDEIHRWASRTFKIAAEMFPAKYRIGASADERRKDGKEYLIYNTFGECRFVITRKELEEKKKLVPLHLHLIPTKYENDEFVLDRDMDVSPDWPGMINDLTSNAQRNKLILKHRY